MVGSAPVVPEVAFHGEEGVDGSGQKRRGQAENDIRISVIGGFFQRPVNPGPSWPFFGVLFTFPRVDRPNRQGIIELDRGHLQGNKLGDLKNPGRPMNI